MVGSRAPFPYLAVGDIFCILLASEIAEFLSHHESLGNFCFMVKQFFFKNSAVFDLRSPEGVGSLFAHIGG